MTNQTATLPGETGRYEIIETRSEGQETRVRSMASGRYKWVLTESLTPDADVLAEAEQARTEREAAEDAALLASFDQAAQDARDAQRALTAATARGEAPQTLEGAEDEELAWATTPDPAVNPAADPAWVAARDDSGQMSDAEADVYYSRLCEEPTRVWSIELARTEATREDLDRAGRSHVPPINADAVKATRVDSLLNSGAVEPTVEDLDAVLAAIPAEYRQTIARWLMQRRDQYHPSLIFPERVISLARDVLAAAAVDLIDPGSEDISLDHAAEVLAGLVTPPAYTAGQAPHGAADVVEAEPHTFTRGWAGRGALPLAAGPDNR